MRFLIVSCVASALAMGVAHASTTVFTDNFDTEGAPGVSILNYGSFANWTVSNGTVDLVAIPNGFGISTCPGAASGKCVDLDGSTSDAGVMTSTALSLGTGNY